MKTIHFLLAGLMASIPLSACSAPSDPADPRASAATTGQVPGRRNDGQARVGDWNH